MTHQMTVSDTALNPSEVSTADGSTRLQLLLQLIARVWTSDLFAYAIIVFGTALRIAQFRFDRALWYDEAALALNLQAKSLSELIFTPLQNGQAAPPGYLLFEKLALTFLGDTEPSLRLVSLIASVLSLLLFYLLAKRILRPLVVPLALFLFAASNSLIGFSAMVKQYSGDVTVALLLMLLTHYIIQASHQQRSIGWTQRHLALLGVVGAVAVWFSHPAIFVLAGMGLSLFLHYYTQQNRPALLRLAIPALLWLGSFAVVYLVSFRATSGNSYLLDYWHNHYFPLIPRSLGQIELFFDIVVAYTRYAMPFSATYSAAMLAAVFGITYFWSGRKLLLFFLLSPLLFTALASGLRLYPFADRLILFLIPIPLILICEGIEEIIRGAGRKLPVVRVAVLLLFAYFATSQINTQQGREEIRPVLRYVQEHAQPGDVIYVHHGAVYAFDYYKDNFGLGDTNYLLGSEHLGEETLYLAEIDPLRGKARVWVLFSHIFNEETSFITSHLNEVGTPLDAFIPVPHNNEIDAQVYLYDLSAGSQ